MEATGVYSQKLARLIQRLFPEQHIAVCNAASISMYTRSFTEEKSDKADAAFIARYGCDRNPAQMRQVDKTEAKLKETVRERDRLVQQKQELGNSQSMLEDSGNRRIHNGLVKQLEKAIDKLNRKIMDIVDFDAHIKEEVDRMSTAPGVGKVSAATIYAEPGSMKQYSRKQISAMSGVCPVNKLSGSSVHKHTMSRRGSRLLRKILFLDSHQAIRRMPVLGEFHERMLGKPESSKMSAKCACMRKLLSILHAMVVRRISTHNTNLKIFTKN